ncbi:MAG: sugar phosphate isomerase/epimerase [Rhodothermaceae bacterium]|nr:sugar phosphate isomerase/epimerase [Rhodothermaceae bacterium]
MSKLNRRSFIGTGVVGAIAAGTGIGCADDQTIQTASAETNASTGSPFSYPVGFQSYGMRREIGEDFVGTLKQVRALGYDSVEMCSPHNPHYQEVGFGGLTNTPPEDIKKMIEDTGLVCESSHFGSNEVLKSDPAKTADFAAAMGLKYLVMSGSGIGNDGTIDDFKRWGEKCNKAAEIVEASGVLLGYHNHRIAPMMEDGKPQYEHIMEVLDPRIIMQFQFASIRDGFDLAFYLDKYAGRFKSLHMHDFDPAMKRENHEGRIGQIVPLGEGIVDWAACIKAAQKSDLAEQAYIVEIETNEPLEGLRRSIDYLKTVQV